MTSGPVNWDRILSSLLHPTQVLILCAVDWIDVPVGPRDLVQVFEGKVHLDNLSYHFRRLGDLGVLEDVGQEQVRGALAKFWRPAP